MSDIDCYQPTGYVTNNTDCDDSTAILNTADADSTATPPAIPTATTTTAINIDTIEVWYDGVDQDCDGWSDYDQTTMALIPSTTTAMTATMNSSSTIVAEDGDCDGTLTADDCDDEIRTRRLLPGRRLRRRFDCG